MANQAVIRTWVGLLRDDRFEQASGYLALPLDDGGCEVCVFGALCMLAVAENVVSVETQECQLEDCDVNHALLFGKRGLQGEPPVEVLTWAGLHKEDTSGEFKWTELPSELVAKIQQYHVFGEDNSETETGWSDLMTLNDDGVPLGVLADVIEAVYL